MIENQQLIILRPLFFLQEKLDKKIQSMYEYDDYLVEDHEAKKALNFRVELGGLLNALGFHKYWSKNPKRESKQKCLEEYVDGLHMLLSLGARKKVADYQYRGLYDFTEQDLTYLFEMLLTMPWLELRKDDYLLGIEMYIKLGEILCFSWDEIKQAYVEKNIKNHEQHNIE